MALIESMNDDDRVDEDDDESDIPEPVMSAEQTIDSSRYADDDIELI
jgi:hypothetical protein